VYEICHQLRDANSPPPTAPQIHTNTSRNSNRQGKRLSFCLIKHYTTKAQGGSTELLTSRHLAQVSGHIYGSSHNPKGKNPRCPVERRPSDQHRRSGLFDGEKDVAHQPRIKPRFFDRRAWSLLTAPTVLKGGLTRILEETYYLLED
jgi:hypothetical protein